MATEFNERARRLRNSVELVAAGVSFAPEAHEKLGSGLTIGTAAAHHCAKQ